jgi:S1-C subfamily serine protease
MHSRLFCPTIPSAGTADETKLFRGSPNGTCRYAEPLLKRTIAALGLLCAAAGAHAMNIATAIQTTVRVQAEQPDGSISIGSGVALPGERVATACHVVSGAKALKASYQYVARPAVVLRQDTGRDLCVLSVPGLTAPAAVIARSTDLKPGDRLLAFNGAFGVDVRLLVGDVTKLHPMDGAPVIETSVPFAIGDSGGGLFNAAGELVGILTFVAKAPGEARYAIPIEWLDADIDASKTMPFWKEESALRPDFLRR